MEELIKALEDLVSRCKTIADDGDGFEQETERLAEDALAMARQHAANVALLHETITGNLEHAIGAWLEQDGHAAMEAAMGTEQVRGENAFIAFAGQTLLIAANDIQSGEWKK